ncbi:ABC transporter permease [Methanoregula sp.]|uniref:ABC transporter permease n=1 Tax=Methanoregula sp. TaxID=2052170 RepID=UPI00236A9429|nr:ABC transporter permease [Methanoregula sp.]MDD1686451.1 ABC transporter permease [Methanoregula sp.]
MIDGQYLLRRIGYSGAAFFVCVSITFFILHLMPGDYITNYLLSLSNTLPKEVVAQFYQQYGLDRPPWEQYLIYIYNILQGQWGYSYQYGLPVFPLIMEKLTWSLVILLPAVLFGIIIGIVLGAWSGWRSGGKKDLALFNFMIVFRAIPEFWWAIMAVWVFAFSLQWFPLGGFSSISVLDSGLDPWDVLYHAILPICLMTSFVATGNYYVMRNSMIAVIGEDYITTARAKGLDEHAVLWNHALKNALLPMVTMTTFQVAGIIMGNVFIETVFSWPGIGLLTTEALTMRDLPLLEGIFLLDALMTIGAMLVADILVSYLDPRIRMGGQ